MNLTPLLGFLWRRGSQITALVSSGKSNDGNSHFLIDMLDANAALIARYYPPINTKGDQPIGLLDDARATLREVLLSSSAPQEDHGSTVGNG